MASVADVVAHLETDATTPLTTTQDRELKKRTPWLKALVSLLDEPAAKNNLSFFRPLGTPRRGVTLERLRNLLEAATTDGVRLSSARVVPAVFDDKTSRFVSSVDVAGYGLRSAVALKLRELRLVMALGKEVRESGALHDPLERSIYRPVFQIDPDVYQRVVASHPGIIGGLEKLASYASHDLLHYVFDAHGRTPAYVEHEASIETDAHTAGFTANIYEYFLFAMMKRTFDEACRLYPGLDEVVMRDAEAFVHAVEHYRGERRALEPVAEHPTVDRECEYLLGIGLSKNLMFIINPGSQDAGEADVAAMLPRERRMRALFERYPFLWRNTALQRAAHSPGLRWRAGPKSGQAVDIIDLARGKFAASEYAALAPSAALARELFGLETRAVGSRILERADKGDPDGMFTMSKFCALDGDESGRERWLQRAATAGHTAAQFERFELMQRTDATRTGGLPQAGRANQLTQSAAAHVKLLQESADAPSDAEEGIRVLTEAADRGDMKAARALFDQAVATKDEVQADLWMRRAAALGDEALAGRLRRRERAKALG